MQKITFLLCFFLVFSLAAQAQEQSYKVAAVGFYNFENLFDTLDTPDVNDTEFTPLGRNLWTGERYQAKLKNLDKVVAEVGTDLTPDGLALLGVAEIENRSVLEDFVKQEGVANRNYQIVHYDSPDRRGIDVALLYNPKYFTEIESRNIPLMITNDEGERIYTRDVLHVKGVLDGDTIHVLVNHWPSRRGGTEASAPKRNAAAMLCKSFIDSLRMVDKDVKVLVMGDLNDDPLSPSVKKYLRSKDKVKRLTPKDMYNPWVAYYKKGYGTLAYRDAWNLFDQILMTAAFTDKEGYFFHKAGIHKKSYMLQKSGRFKGYPFRTYAGGAYAGGYSDHFPVYVYLVKVVE